jgi:hypothetical protein
MGVVEISMLLLKIPLLVILGLLQAILSLLDKLSGFFTGLLTLMLTGFLVYHCILGNRENVILLSISLGVCIGIPVLFKTASILLGRISEIIS